jgi:membrane protein DedA with SNARE-associated domain
LLLASITSFVADHGVPAVFVLMALAAVVPAGSELVMIYAGSLAATADHVTVFGHQVTSSVGIYLAVSLAGLAGNIVGATGGWAIGIYGGRPLLERHGRWLHVTPERLTRAEQRLERYQSRAVPVGFATPGLRSFVAIPAGIVRMPLARFLPLAVIGCAVFCFGLAAGGWALGSSYERLHHVLQIAAIAIIALALVVAGIAIWHARRSSRLTRRASDPAR